MALRAFSAVPSMTAAVVPFKKSRRDRPFFMAAPFDQRQALNYPRPPAGGNAIPQTTFYVESTILDSKTESGSRSQSLSRCESGARNPSGLLGIGSGRFHRRRRKAAHAAPPRRDQRQRKDKNRESRDGSGNRAGKKDRQRPLGHD